VLSVDYYEFGLNGRDADLDTSFLWRDLGYLRKRAVETGKPLWFYFQGSDYDGNAGEMTAGRLRLQMNAGLAYGCRWLCYWTSSGTITDREGRPAALFDEASAVLLDHIDILAKTAEDFSTFAKLYSEEPVEVDLDKMLQNEVAMFDNRGNIRFDYLGLEGARVLAPKPQLTRVFVNLLNNAIQAIGDRPDGRIAVSLRLSSSKENCYDIVFEDNGPGVAEEHVGKLFTPNFTTKDGGSGLGLAISRNILERSGATITYSRSFALGGACFTICYPRNCE